MHASIDHSAHRDHASSRDHSMDGLRAGAMLLGVVLHAALAYMAVEAPAVVRDSSQSRIFDLFVLIIHAFRMPLFFLVSGYFAAMMLKKYGTARFLRARSTRVLLPLTLGVCSVGPLALWPWASWTMMDKLPMFDALTTAISSQWVWWPPRLAHLWFLYYLALITGGAVVVHWACERGRLMHAAAKVGGVIGWLSCSWIGWFVLGLPVVALTLASGAWYIQTPHGWVPDLNILGTYGWMFAWGWALWSTKTTSAHSGRLWKWAMGLSVVPLFLMIVLGSAALPKLQEAATQAGRPLWTASVPAALAHSLFMCMGITASLGIFARWFHRERRWVRLGADASYWVYLVHLPIVYLLHVLMLGWQVSCFVKFAANLAITLPLCFGSYFLFVRGSRLGWILDGVRIHREHPANEITKTVP